jgi:hypothetical protein
VKRGSKNSGRNVEKRQRTQRQNDIETRGNKIGSLEKAQGMAATMGRR